MQYTTGQNSALQSMINLCHLLCRQKMVGIELTLSQQVQEKTEKNSRINHNIEQNIILQILRSA